MRNLSFVMVGHVDHGKSTLIGRLLYDTGSLPPDKIEEIKAASQEQGREVEFAYVMDHLEEERSRNITIDTAQIFFKTPQREYVIIDAPGHKEFLKNMITGASQAEAAVLIVDAEEGVREQTQRHAYIISLLGLEQLIVVVNKLDVLDYSEEKYKEIDKELAKFLEKIGLKPNYVIPISAKKGDNVSNRSENMDWYDGVTFLEALDSFKNLPSSFEKPLRFPVQDVYRIDGEQVLVGRLEAGRLNVGDEVLFLPAEKKAVVAAIKEFLVEGKKTAEAGESIGMVLVEEAEIGRGEVACRPSESAPVSDRFKASVFWMSPQPLDREEPLLFKCATEEVPARIEKIEERINSSTLEILEEDARRLNDTEVGEVIISTEKPVVIESFYKTKELGRFVLARGLDVVAGGIISHPVIGA